MIRAALLIPTATGWLFMLDIPLIIVCMSGGIYVGVELQLWTIQDREGMRTRSILMTQLHCNYLTFRGIRTRWVTDLEEQASCPRSFYEQR
jgi:hypothetical protein